MIIVLIVSVLSQCKKDTLPSTIPDKNFLNALIERGVDKNGDGIISTGEAAEVTFLNVNSCSISDLKCIEGFINMNSLYCNYNKLTSLDVSNNTALTELYCHDNQLTSLNLTNNTAINYLGLMSLPSLYKVCVWTMPFPPDGVTVATIDSPNVYFTMECNQITKNPEILISEDC